jgi:uncharacterized protein DUF1579
MRPLRGIAVGAFLIVLSAPVTTVGQQPPAPPTPGPEHAILKMDEGTWDATVEFMPPGMPPMTSKAIEVNTLGCGGLCLITDFTGEAMPGVPFQGHGVGTWDAVKKKYVGSWTDSMSKGLSLGESTWDPAAKRMTGWMEGPDMEGKVTKTRSVVEYKDGTRVFTGYQPGPDGKEAPIMRITYTKRK